MKRRGERILVAVQKVIPINLRRDTCRSAENVDYYILTSNDSWSFIEALVKKQTSTSLQLLWQEQRNVCIERVHMHLYNPHLHNVWAFALTWSFWQNLKLLWAISWQANTVSPSRTGNSPYRSPSPDISEGNLHHLFSLCIIITKAREADRCFKETQLNYV